MAAAHFHPAPKRALITNALVATPGHQNREIARELNVSISVVARTRRSLERRGAIACFWPPQGAGPSIWAPYGGDATVMVLELRGKRVLIDRTDYAAISPFRWFVYPKGSCWYADRSAPPGQSPQKVLLHREIMQPAPDELIDHINHDGLDNRRANLRICTKAQNSWNKRPKSGSSRFKGVSWHRTKGRWIARIRADGRDHHIGGFLSETDAARAYDAIAKQLHGRFACLNFPEAEAA